MLNLKDMVKGDKQVTFTRAFDDALWYKTDCGFEFPVSYAETKGATFKAVDKAMFFMRYIRKHIAIVQLT